MASARTAENTTSGASAPTGCGEEYERNTPTMTSRAIRSKDRGCLRRCISKVYVGWILIAAVSGKPEFIFHLLTHFELLYLASHRHRKVVHNPYITRHFEIVTGTAASGRTSASHQFNPPLCVNYSSGARSITIRVDANDASCVISTGWHGWVEKET